MNLVDSKFIGLVSSRLQKFKRIKPDLYNFRCPICGDSQKNKSKTRGYLYSVKADMNFRCHNCGASMTLSNFLKEIDPVIHKQYVFERFKTNSTGRGTVVEEPTFKFEEPKFKTKLSLPPCSEVQRGREYLESRRLDPERFYWAEDFAGFVNSIKPTFGSNVPKESRIIIPLYYNKKLVGIQGRSVDPSPVKYITTIFYDDAPKIYGLDQIRGGAPVFVTEGPFDSTFIRNSIAMCGADADINRWGISDAVWIYDNEPRNAEIVKRIQTAISSKQTVVIWPSNVPEKDINDMVMSGHDVQKIVEENIYSGLEATIKFNNWKKV